MSAQIDIISEYKEPGQGSWVRIEEIAKASTPTLEDRYRFAARSVNLTWRLCVKSSLRPFADELETKAEVRNFNARLLLLTCGGPGDLSRGNTKRFRLNARKFLEITPIDIPHKTTVYKKVIIFASKEGNFVILTCWLSHRWEHHGHCWLSRIPVLAELRRDAGLDVGFQRISGKTRSQHRLEKIRAKS